MQYLSRFSNLIFPYLVLFSSFSCGDNTHLLPRSSSYLELRLIPDNPLYLSPQINGHRKAYTLFFHLNIKNESNRPSNIEEISIHYLQNGHRIREKRLLKDELKARLRPLAWIVYQNPQSFSLMQRYREHLNRHAKTTYLEAKREMSVLNIFSRFVDILPDELRVFVKTSSGVTKLKSSVFRFQQKTNLRLPIRGPWFVLAGNQIGENHSRLDMLSQRFAHDFVITDKKGQTYRGDKHKPESYFAYDQPIYSVASGKVVRVYSGAKENRHVGRRPSWRYFLKNLHEIAGNYVVIEHRAGEYSAYFHLRSNIEVKAGQRVEQGERIGYCGNSGNSVEPHLHVQLQDSDNPLTARGLPASFSSFKFQYGRQGRTIKDDKKEPLPIRLWIEDIKQ